MRSVRERVGLLMKLAVAGSFWRAPEKLASSAWTFVRVWGDFARAAPYTALEYFAAMVEAARRPRPGADAERAMEASNIMWRNGIPPRKKSGRNGHGVSRSRGN